MSYLVTNQYLAGKTDAELGALQKHFTDALVRSEPGSPERRNALANLENIARARSVLGMLP